MFFFNGKVARGLFQLKSGEIGTHTLIMMPTTKKRVGHFITVDLRDMIRTRANTKLGIILMTGMV